MMPYPFLDILLGIPGQRQAQEVAPQQAQEVALRKQEKPAELLLRRTTRGIQLP
jgi:hypothetical protein